MIILHDIQITGPCPNAVLSNLPDTGYWAPDRKWVGDWWTEHLRDNKWTPTNTAWYKKMFGASLRTYTKRNDCDNFSLRALATSVRLFTFTDPKLTGNALSPALFDISIETTTGRHAMNMVFMDTGHGIAEIRLIEPQNPQLLLVIPSKKQLENIRRIRG